MDGTSSCANNDPVVAKAYCLNVELRIKDRLLRIRMLYKRDRL